LAKFQDFEFRAAFSLFVVERACGAQSFQNDNKLSALILIKKMAILKVLKILWPS
jgi:hypothetical protein